MSQGEHVYEESITLDHYVNISKRDTLAIKKLKKEEERPRRKESTQMSIFSWLQKGPSQNCAILELDKSLILKIFGYLRMSDLVSASGVCSYFLSCYRSLWSDKEFFGQLETDKFTSEELGKVIQLARLDHIRQLRHIYSGKSIRFCREKIKIKVGSGGPNTGGMLEIFSVTPKNPHAGSTFIMDSHLSQVVLTSFRSLRVVELVKCGFIHDFVSLSKCTNLMRLVISFNEYLSLYASNFKNQDLGVICKRCPNLQQIHLESCRRLDENVFEHLMYVQMLESLTLKTFRQSFGKLKKMANNAKLTTLDLEGSMINDSQAFQVIQLKFLTFLSVKHCELLTEKFIDYLTSNLPKTRLKKVITLDCGFDEKRIEVLEAALSNQK